MRIKKGMLGEVKIPDDIYWGSETALAIENFEISNYRLHPVLLKENILSKTEIEELLTPANIYKLGFSDEKS